MASKRTKTGPQNKRAGEETMFLNLIRMEIKATRKWSDEQNRKARMFIIGIAVKSYIPSNTKLQSP